MNKVREKNQMTYKGKSTKSRADSSTKTFKARIHGVKYFED
jgi:hypothetical protein